MVYMKLIVPLGCLAATSLATLLIPTSEASELTPFRGHRANRLSTLSFTDCGGGAESGDAEGAPSTQDPPKISSRVFSPTPGDIDVPGSCNKAIGRGLSDHLNPTIPDEDEGEE